MCFLCEVSDENIKGNNPSIYCAIWGIESKRPMCRLQFLHVSLGGHLPRVGWGGGGIPALVAENAGHEPSAPSGQCGSTPCLLVAVCARLFPSLQVSGRPVDGFLEIGME